MRRNLVSSSPTSPGSTSMPKSAMRTSSLRRKPPNPLDGRRTDLSGFILSAIREGESMSDEVDAELRTFLIADVRGYTSFTQRHGDEIAAKLAGKFARV